MQNTSGHLIIFRKTTRAFIVETDEVGKARQAVFDFASGKKPSVPVYEDRKFGDIPELEAEYPLEYFGEEWELEINKIKQQGY